MEQTLTAIVLFLYGTFVSWVEERFGKFQDLTPSMKQLVNAILTIVVPGIALWLAPLWRPEFGIPEDAANALLYLLAPAAIWLFSQIAHYFDPSLWIRPGEALIDADDVNKVDVQGDSGWRALL